MANHVYKTIEITGSSTKGVQDAIEVAVAKTTKTVHNVRWFEVIDTRGYVEANKIAHWQVTLKIGFTLDN